MSTYLCFPLHADNDYKQQNNDSDAADDANVLNSTVNDLKRERRQ